MEKSGKRGKIPQQDWPSIIKRYEAGETLANIARTYDCSPPAISYILNRSRARDSNAERAVPAATASSEAHAVRSRPSQTPNIEALHDKAGGTGTAAQKGAAASRSRAQQREVRAKKPPRHPAEDLSPEQAIAVPEARPTAESQDAQSKDQGRQNIDPPLGGSGVHEPRTVPDRSPGNEPRRTLHLSLFHADAHRSAGERPEASGSAQHSAGPSASTQQSPPRASQASPAHYGMPRNGGVMRMMSEPLMSEPRKMKEAGAFIDQALRERVDGDIAAFLAAFDEALARDTPASRAGLRAATDRLLRAGARTRIELERLEARAPLPRQDELDAR